MSARLDEELLVVVREVALDGPAARGEERVQRLRVAALGALSECAALRGARLGSLAKDERDAPRASNGWHWSISHSSLASLGLVVASVSRSPVGVDAESSARRPRSGTEVALSPAERALLRGLDDDAVFARVWTAKEAVLKKLGLGLTALSEVRLEDATPDAAVLERGGERHPVEWRVHGPFVIAVSGRARERVDWRLPAANAGDARREAGS